MFLDESRSTQFLKEYQQAFMFNELGMYKTAVEMESNLKKNKFHFICFVKFSIHQFVSFCLCQIFVYYKFWKFWDVYNIAKIKTGYFSKIKTYILIFDCIISCIWILIFWCIKLILKHAKLKKMLMCNDKNLLWQRLDDNS